MGFPLPNCPGCCGQPSPHFLIIAGGASLWRPATPSPPHPPRPPPSRRRGSALLLLPGKSIAAPAPTDSEADGCAACAHSTQSGCGLRHIRVCHGRLRHLRPSPPFCLLRRGHRGPLAPGSPGLSLSLVCGSGESSQLLRPPGWTRAGPVSHQGRITNSPAAP